MESDNDEMLAPQGVDLLKGKYRIFEKIGQGTYGKVYRAVDTTTGKLVAIKKIIFMDDGEGYPATSLREISILTSLDHPNVVKIIEVVSSPSKLLIVFEHMETDLHNCIKNEGVQLSRYEVKVVMWQLLSAVAYIHSRRVLHRDIKPANLLLEGGVLKLADFGLARQLSEPARPYSPNSSTPCYMSPEMALLKTQYSTETDIWSCGCVFYEIITGAVLFTPDSEMQLFDMICQKIGKPEPEDWPEVFDDPNLGQFMLYFYNRHNPHVSMGTSFVGLDVENMGLDLLEVVVS